jgi:very-short-patch-repair endonuclease
MRGARAEAISFARKLRREMTSAEQALWQQLRARRFDGFKFVRQQPIGPYYADFLYREAKLVVEIDGATQPTLSELRHDEKRTEYLHGLGYRLIRFQNGDVYEALEGVLHAIETALSEKLK